MLARRMQSVSGSCNHNKMNDLPICKPLPGFQCGAAIQFGTALIPGSSALKAFKVFGFTAVLLSLSLVSWAEKHTLPSFTVSAGISETSLNAGAPLYVYLKIARKQDNNRETATVSISSNNDNVSIHIEDLEGREVGKHLEQPWSEFVGLGFNLFKEIEAGQAFTKSLIVHYWSDTTLPPGHYSVIVEVPQLSFHMEAKRREWHPALDEPFRRAFPIEILPPDNERVAQIFQKNLAAAKSRETPWNERYRALDTILLAQGPAALGAQLDLIAAMDQDAVRFAYGQKEIVTMLWNIVQHNDVATALALAELARGPVFGENTMSTDKSGRGIWPMLGWAIHEIHRKGSAEVQAVTSPLLDVVPDKPGLVESTFMDGGIEIDRNY